MDVEQMLARELHEVADGLTAPPLPPIPARAPLRSWVPVLFAAVVVLIVAAAATLVGRVQQAVGPPPAQHTSLTPSPSPTPGTAGVPTTPPAEPWAKLVGNRLYVDGTQAPGTWGELVSRGPTWVAETAGPPPVSVFWGTGPQARALPGAGLGGLAISPDGHWLAYAALRSDGVHLARIDTRTGPDPLEVWVSARTPGWGVDAVTDDGIVLAWGCKSERPTTQSSPCGSLARHVWDPPRGNILVGESELEPIQGDGPGGWVWTSGYGAVSVLARVDAHGAITKVRRLPSGQAAVDHAGERIALIVDRDSLLVERLDGNQPTVELAPPAGWPFDTALVSAGTWEGNDLLLVPLWSRAAKAGGLARCSISRAKCVLVDV